MPIHGITIVTAVNSPTQPVHFGSAAVRMITAEAPAVSANSGGASTQMKFHMRAKMVLATTGSVT